ncbi:Dihydropteroate synthase (DHPS) (Dihydropteroate pyrophosphorylase) [Bradyrhizobium sp. ORS 375]|uniref:dihydropteroate synthase n=1 Tax=Bradyrhizobium sp. (strain ORS 375) TaxID=566679 RepID=UPI0002407A52|nr:dihydropteroate synthase [Bradyrhizobium sp. ORS 375]CCD93172.1 Dihydropteroate synthase (DHPS) (Dihydropteroate pyrophosphorylase) [Bradyrhizobium sp. ORS 375]
MSATLPHSAPDLAASHPLLRAWLARPYPAVMGILNVTPDSFSDGGRFNAPERALEQARAMIAAGADIIDIGAESTRPYKGAEPVSAEEELARLEPVLPAIVALGVPVSIDSMKSKIVGHALRHGAQIANDVWGLQRDPEMAEVVAAHRVPIVVMHNRAAVDPEIDIIDDMLRFFARSLDIAAKAGIPEGNIVLDPGIGFGKTAEQSMRALARLDAFARFGLPLLVGASRKRFISSVVTSEPHQRLGGSIAAHLIAAQRGAAIIRAHDVAETVQAVRVAAAIEALG